MKQLKPAATPPNINININVRGGDKIKRRSRREKVRKIASAIRRYKNGRKYRCLNLEEQVRIEESDSESNTSDNTSKSDGKRKVTLISFNII